MRVEASRGVAEIPSDLQGLLVVVLRVRRLFEPLEGDAYRVQRRTLCGLVSGLDGFAVCRIEVIERLVEISPPDLHLPDGDQRARTSDPGRDTLEGVTGTIEVAFRLVPPRQVE